MDLLKLSQKCKSAKLLVHLRVYTEIGDDDSGLKLNSLGEGKNAP